MHYLWLCKDLSEIFFFPVYGIFSRQHRGSTALAQQGSIQHLHANPQLPRRCPFPPPPPPSLSGGLPTPGRTQAGATGARAQRCPGWGRAAIGRGGCWWGRVSAGLSAQLSRGRDSLSPARTHQSSRQPLIRQTGLGGGWRARAPPSPSKLCRGKKIMQEITPDGKSTN